VKPQKRRNPVLLPVSDEVKAWSAALAAEITEWPLAVARSFFGFNALYRGDHIFGMLPRTRSFGNGNLLAFRIDDLSDRRKARLQKDPPSA
jgi:5-methylthioribose kinase